jgi:hypothetical protein
VDAEQSFINRVWENVLEWMKSKYAVFMSWLTSDEIYQFVRRYRIRGFVCLLLTPIFIFIPVFSILGSFKMFSYDFWIGFIGLVFAIFTCFVFIGLPLIFLYAIFNQNNYWRAIQICSGVIIIGFSIFWGYRFYHSFLPTL